MKLWLDFETRSRVDLRQVGADKYAKDPSTDVLCAAFAVDQDDVKIWLPHERCPDEIVDAVENNWGINSHNVSFEDAIWSNVMTPKYGWPTLPRSNLHCTAAKAAYANIPRSLDAACRTLDMGDAGKDAEGHKVMMKLCKPNRKGEWINDREFLDRLYEYCKQDVRAERELDQLLPEWPEEEREVWLINHEINLRGVPIDRKFCCSAINILAREMNSAKEKLSKETNGEITSGKQVQRILKFINQRGVNVDNLQQKTVESVLSESELDDTVQKILELRQSVSSAAVGKYATAIARIEDDDRVRGQFLYFGAAPTGRFSGAGGLQVQNFKKPGKNNKLTPEVIDAITLGDSHLIRSLYKSSPIQVLGNAVRGIVRAPDGYRLILSDLSQIECRVAHWLANDSRTLGFFREGRDMYKELATKIYKVPLDKVTTEQRFISKCAVLGLGYGMGAKKFQSMCANSPDPVFLDEKFAKKVVDIYRSTNKEIISYWGSLDRAAVNCITKLKKTKCGKVIFDRWRDWMTIELPSGRKMYYHQPLLVAGQFGPQFQYIRRGTLQYVWGGTFLENLCQAISRDILVCAMKTLRDHKIILHVHDEIGVLAAEDQADRVARDVENALKECPVWASGLPLEAETKIAERFEK